MDKSLVGIVIDPGHGGSDSGALGNNLKEKDYNLMISKYMYDRFKELGIPVALTRDSDKTLAPNERTNLVLDAFGNNPNVVVVSNHLNAGGGTGAEVIYALRNSDVLAKDILNNIADTGQSVRKYYQRRLPSDTSKDYYFMHRNTGRTQPVIVEYGFIDDTPDKVKYLQDNYKQLAEAVIKAIAEYAGYKYTSPFAVSDETYTVKAGDSLYAISKKFGLTVDELKKLNNLTSNTLKIGQVLKIKSSTTSTVTPGTINYTVKSGDNLYAIARKYNTTVDEIKKLNNLASNTLSIGQVLKIPITTPSQELPSETYVVQRGDSLYSIARKLGTTVDKLKNFNNLTSNLLSVGQVLKIPTSQKQTTYTVQKGDSLYSIAKKFNTSVDNLKALNNLSSNLLSIGQILVIE